MAELKIPVNEACNLLSVSRSHYNKLKTPKSKPAKDAGLRRNLHEIASKNPGFGYRRITHKLREIGLEINCKKVLKVMREERLLVRKKRKFKPITTQSKNGLKVYPNRIKKNQDTQSQSSMGR